MEHVRLGRFWILSTVQVESARHRDVRLRSSDGVFSITVTHIGGLADGEGEILRQSLGSAWYRGNVATLWEKQESKHHTYPSAIC